VKLGEGHIKEANKIHLNSKNNKTETVNDTTFIKSWEEDMNGQNINVYTS
jgi:hypothetical protein